MTAKMTVVYLDHTGHVLGALREPASGSPKLEALVGDAFPLPAVRRTGRFGRAASFDLPPSILKSKSVTLDERVIANPQRFAIDSDRVALLPDPAPGFTLTTGLTQTTVTLTLAAGPLAATKVLIVVRGNTADYREQRIQAGSFVAMISRVDINLAIVPPGPEAGLRVGQTCDVAIALAGLPLRYATEFV